jgi:hypothetical protein
MELMQQFIDGKISLLDQQLKESTEAVAGIGQFKEYVRGEISSQGDKLIQTYSNVSTNFDQLNEDILRLTVDLDRTNGRSQATALKAA